MPQLLKEQIEAIQKEIDWCETHKDSHFGYIAKDYKRGFISGLRQAISILEK